MQTPFGRFWVVRDGTEPAAVGPRGLEVMTEAQLREAQQAWSDIVQGAGRIRVFDSGGLQTFPGFRDLVMHELATLMSRRRGRRLIVELTHGAHTVTILPSMGVRAHADGGEAAPVNDYNETLREVPLGGANVIIHVDPELRQSAPPVDREGLPIAHPAFITLGHELIHARHHTRGERYEGPPIVDPAYDNLEEEVTIAGGGDFSENALREEHRVDLDAHGHTRRRFGHHAAGSLLPRTR